MTQVEWQSELAGAEKLFALSSLPFNSSAYNLTCVLLLSSKIPKEKLQTCFLVENLIKAVNKVHTRHPLLQAVIPAPEKDEKLFFVKYNLPRPVDVSKTEKKWQDLQEQEMNTPFSWKQLLYRVKIAIDASYIMVTMHHCLADAGALFTYLTDLLTVLDFYNLLSLPDSDHATIQKELDNIAVLPVPEQPYEYVTSRQHLLSLQTLQGALHAGWMLAQPHKKSPDVLFPLKKELKQENMSHMLNFVVPKDITAKLIAYCKQNKVSVPSYLCAMIAKSLSDTAARTLNMPHYETHVPFNMTRDLRRNPLIAYPMQNIRSCSGGFGQCLLIKDNSVLVELAQQVKKGMETSLAFHEDVAAFLLQTPHNFSFIQKVFPHGPPFPVMIGSLGIFDLKCQTMDVEMVNAGLAIHNVMDFCSLAFYTSADCLHLCLTYSAKQEEKPVLAWWKELVKEVQQV